LDKCFDRIMELRRAGKTLLSVSHHLESLPVLCDRALWLDQRRVVYLGPLRQVVRAFRDFSSPQTPPSTP
jgi:lipopolysaccharide transport system ATP-binding protein